MRQLDALRRAGRARRVDQRQDVVGLRPRASAASTSKSGFGRPRRRASASVPSGASPSTTITCSSAGSSRARLQHRRQVRLLDDRDARAGVADDVADLLGAGGLVDRERRRAERHRREVAEVELGPVAHHQRDRVAARDAEPGEPARERVDALAQLGPGQRDAVVERADRDDVRVGGGGAPQRLAERRGVDGRRRRRATCCLPSASPPRRRRLAGQPRSDATSAHVEAAVLQAADVVREADHEQHDHEREADDARRAP